MADDVQGDDYDIGSIASALSSLEGDDEFERLMIQNARDERRRQAALHGDRAQQPFAKARTHARVGLTMDRLMRNDAHNSSTSAANARVALQSPPSSRGSTSSDPAMRAPAGWGRKGRTSRDWLKSIARDEQRHDEQRVDGAAPPSPLSHKSFVQAHALNDGSGEWDLTFDMNEASMLVSTPYLPRNNKLDDIHARETESLRETGLAAARLDRARESPPELAPATSPVAVYSDTAQAIAVVERRVAASAARQAATPSSNRRTDSQDLLRLISRASNTPSPKETRPARPRPHPQPSPTSQPHSPPPTESNVMPVQSAVTPSTSQPHSPPHTESNVMPVQTTATPSTSPPQEQPQLPSPLHNAPTPHMPSSAPTPEHVDATPLLLDPSVLQPKTPAVMGAWVDTPGPRTLTLHPPEPTQAPTEAPLPAEQIAEPPQPSPPRPRLPGSALDALVQQARANHDYGDDTLHSLEDLMTSPADDEVEEDTLQGLQLPTSAPRSEAERGRHAEAEDVHRLHRHLRSTSTSLRDTSRGIRRASRMVEHQPESTSASVPVLVHDLSREFSPLPWLRSFFWNERLKTQRETKNAPLRMWGGLTLLGILLTLSFIWWASEIVACEMFCHPEFASYSPYPFAVNMDAPKRGVVIPTLVYRALFKNWATPIISPIASLSSWLWASCWSLLSGVNVTGLSRSSYKSAANGGPAVAVHTQASRIQEETHEEDSWDWSMAEDEILRR